MKIFADGLLRDKVVLITGGGTGIGRGIALGMAGYGARLVLASRNLDNLQAVATEVASHGVRALPVRTDIRRPDQVDALLRMALDTFGHIDVLVNNAAGSFLAAARKLTLKGWNSVLDTILNGTFFCDPALQGLSGADCPHRSEGRSRSTDQNPGSGVGQVQHFGERHCPRTGLYARVYE